MNEKKVHKSDIADDAIQLVTFQVGDQEYGVDIHRITEVRPLKITPLPQGYGQAVAGVFLLVDIDKKAVHNMQKKGG